MSTILKTAGGILLAGAISGFVWLGVAYPAAFVRLVDQAKSGILPLVWIGLSFCALMFFVHSLILAISIKESEDSNDKQKDDTKSVIFLGEVILFVVVGLVALAIYVAVVRTISEAVNPEYYENLSSFTAPVLSLAESKSVKR